MGLKWLKGPLRTLIKVNVDRSMTGFQAQQARKQAKPIPPKKPKDGKK
jgi:hypothetical protein